MLKFFPISFSNNNNNNNVLSKHFYYLNFVIMTEIPFNSLNGI